MRRLTEREKELFKTTTSIDAPRCRIYKFKYQRGDGITFYRLILHKDPGNTASLLHEVAHVDQYMNNKFTFLPIYFWSLFKYGYENIPFEIEAEKIEAAVKILLKG